MRKGRLLSLLAMPVAVSLAVAGCGGGGETGGEAGAKTDPNGTLVYAEVEPEALVPGATTRTRAFSPPSCCSRRW